MRVICCGCRTLTDPAVIERAVAAASFGPDMTTVLSGAQATYDGLGRPAGGADWLFERWAEARGIAVERFPAAWDDLTAPGAVVRVGRGGRPYNAFAGPARNARMLDAAPDAVLAVWDGKSRGTLDLLRQANERRARGLRLLIHVHRWAPGG